jgi:hypothetical protein
MNSIWKAPAEIQTGGNLHDTSVYAIEVHEIRNGKLVKERGFRVGGVFISATMEKGKVTEMMSEGTFPPKRMHQALRKYYGRYETKTVPELGGLGLFTRKDIKAGDLIGIYAGKVTDTGGNMLWRLANN